VSEVTDTGYAPSRWAFDDEVTRVFDDMLKRSIPQYDVMRQTVTDVAAAYVTPATTIVDLGCSRGEALAPLVRRFGAVNRYVGLEVAPAMLAAARTRFAGFDFVEILEHDLRLAWPARVRTAQVALSVLTLQFVPIEHRQRVIADVFAVLAPGGAFVLVEKVLGADASIDAAMVAAYYGLKADSGYTNEEIERKRLALEGVLVPITARWNEDMLRTEGFARVDCFWRWMNFAAWVAVK